jgi:hypothetical protein
VGDVAVSERTPNRTVTLAGESRMIVVPHDPLGTDALGNPTHDIGRIAVLYHEVAAVVPIPVSQRAEGIQHERHAQPVGTRQDRIVEDEYGHHAALTAVSSVEGGRKRRVWSWL